MTTMKNPHSLFYFVMEMSQYRQTCGTHHEDGP